MNTTPSIDAMLEALIFGLEDDILPGLSNPKAQATAVMMQSVLQTVRQLLPVYDGYIIDEHNAMTKVLRDAAAALEGVDAAAAERVRERAADDGARDDLPAPHDMSAAMAAHRELGTALAATMVDLDELQRGGVAPADEALNIVRSHLGSRYVRDVATVTVGEGLVGRG